jgi:hypothetical protein
MSQVILLSLCSSSSNPAAVRKYTTLSGPEYVGSGSNIPNTAGRKEKKLIIITIIMF